MRSIYINTEDFDVNVAIVEDKKLVNFFTEKNIYAKAGNIYKGKITRILSNMNFVFVDIGDSRPAFLSEKEYFDFAGADYREILSEEAEGMEIKLQGDAAGIFEKGQELIVQIIKEPHNTKGARLTTNIMLPAHYTVFAPFLQHTGVSRRIEDERERQRLKNLIEEAISGMKEDFGVIARTQAGGVKKKDIEKEIRHYCAEWMEIKKGFEKNKAPHLLYEEEELPLRVIREYADESTGEVIVDSEETYREIKNCLRDARRSNVRVKLYDGVNPVFEYYKIQNQIDSIYNSIVPLKKGGYIKVDVTEALTVIDINSGKFKGVDDVENSLLLMNINAAKEIARQIILRNIGGLIVIDFVDMQKDENREKVEEAVVAELSRSKVYFKAGKISEFGLMEITRKREAKMIDDIYFEECSVCSGRGFVLTEENICINYLKKIKYECKKELNEHVAVLVPGDIKKKLQKEYKDKIKEYERKYRKKVILKAGGKWME